MQGVNFSYNLLCFIYLMLFILYKYKLLNTIAVSLIFSSEFYFVYPLWTLIRIMQTVLFHFCWLLKPLFPSWPKKFYYIEQIFLHVSDIEYWPPSKMAPGKVNIIFLAIHQSSKVHLKTMKKGLCCQLLCTFISLSVNKMAPDTLHQDNGHNVTQQHNTNVTLSKASVWLCWVSLCLM